MSESQSTGQIGKILSELRTRSARRKRMRNAVYLFLLVSVTVLLSLLAGCATSAPPPCEQSSNPPPPVAISPMPTISYSLKAETLFKRWQQMLTNAMSSDKP